MIPAQCAPLGSNTAFPARVFAHAPPLCGANSLSPHQAPLRRIELRAKPENMHP